MRRFLCLFLALAVLILCPLRVAATSVVFGQAIVTGASALLVVAGILYGLGVMPSSDPTVFETTRDAGVEYLRAGGHVDDEGFMEIIGYQDPAGVLRTYVSQNIIESIRDWLFSSGVVVSNSVTLPENYSSVFAEAYAIASAQPYAALVNFKNGTTAIVYAKYPFAVSGNYLDTPDSTQQFKAWDPTYTSAWFANVSQIEMTNVSSVQYFGTGIIPVSTSHDLTLGAIADVDEKIETGYETWVDESIISIDVGIQFEDDPEDPNDDDKNIVPFWPVHTGNSLPTGTVQEMQSAAQSGLTDLEIDFSGGSGSGDGSGTGSDSGGSSPGASWNPPSDHSQFALVDLKKYFPFCIPFDLFEFFSLLNADPVAPVFHWELQDLSGRSYSIDIDLSEWDSVARIFRLLQLFLFITGLAAASRKFIKW